MKDLLLDLLYRLVIQTKHATPITKTMLLCMYHRELQKRELSTWKWEKQTWKASMMIISDKTMARSCTMSEQNADVQYMTDETPDRRSWLQMFLCKYVIYFTTSQTQHRQLRKSSSKQIYQCGKLCVYLCACMYAHQGGSQVPVLVALLITECWKCRVFVLEISTSSLFKYWKFQKGE